MQHNVEKHLAYVCITSSEQYKYADNIGSERLDLVYIAFVSFGNHSNSLQNVCFAKKTLVEISNRLENFMYYTMKNYLLVTVALAVAVFSGSCFLLIEKKNAFKFNCIFILVK